MTSADSQQKLQHGDSSTGTPARGLQHGDSSTGESVLVNAIRPTVDGVSGTFLQVRSSADTFSFSPSWSRLIRIWFVLAAGVLLLAVVAKLQWIFSNPLWEDVAIGGVWLTLAGIVLEFWAASALLLAPRINGGLGGAGDALRFVDRWHGNMDFRAELPMFRRLETGGSRNSSLGHYRSTIWLRLPSLPRSL